MERQESVPMSLTELEYDILDECYFINSYEEIWSAVKCDKNDFRGIILSLLEREYIQQLLFNKENNDYDRQMEFKPEQLESAKYVITKQGLLLHTGLG